MISDRNCRALQQVILDWQHEVAQATSHVDAVLRHLRSTAALVRTLCLIAVGEMFGVLRTGWTVRFLAWLLGMTIFLTAWFAGFQWIGGIPFELSARLPMRFVQSLISFIPIALFLTIATGPKTSSSPAIGLPLCAFGVFVALAAFALPLSWEYFVDARIGRPLDPAIYAPKSRWQSVAILSPVILSWVLLADRIRVDRRRATLLLWIFWAFTLTPIAFGFFWSLLTFTPWVRDHLALVASIFRWVSMLYLVLPIWLWRKLVRDQAKEKTLQAHA